MSTGKLDRADKVALGAALVAAVVLGGATVCYMATMLFYVMKGRPLGRLGRAVAAAISPRTTVDEDDESRFEFHLAPGDDEWVDEWMIDFYRGQADSSLAAGDTLMAVFYLDAAGYNFIGLRDMDSALACHRLAQELRELAAMDPPQLAVGRAAVAGAFAAFGMQDSALVEYLAAHELYTEIGDPELSAQGAWWLHGCLESLGEERFAEVALTAGRAPDEVAGLVELAREAEEPAPRG